MLNEEKYEILKDSFLESQRLFNKLGVVATNASNITYDESGLYHEEEEVCERHWLKLSSKIVDGISQSLEGYSIELLKNDSLEKRELVFNINKDEIKSKIVVEYSENDSLRITQIS